MDTKPNPDWKPNALDLTVVERLTLAAATPKILTDKRQAVILQKDQQVVYLPSVNDDPLPDHIRQAVHLVELESFNNYVKQFKTATTRIFGMLSATGAKFSAVLNYHEAGKEAKAGRGTHKAAYEPVFSDEFAPWYSRNGKGHTQDEFLDHLRKFGYVVTSHTDADLIELASNLEFTAHGNFASKVERKTGGRQLTYNEQIEGTAQVKNTQITVPDTIKMKMPVFQGGREYEMEADLLYRVSSGRLSIAWEIKQVAKLIRSAVTDLVKDVESGTELDVFVGRLD